MLGKRMKELRKERKLTQSNLAEELSVTQQAVAKWESGRSSPDPATLMQIAEYFGVSVDSLLGREDVLPFAKPFANVVPYKGYEEQMVPVVGLVRAGYGALAFQEDRGMEPANVRDPENYFYLVVRGNSMEPRIQDGDLALVRRQNALDDGDLGVVVYGEGEGTLKRYRRKGNAIILQPFNPEYEAIILSGEELEHFYIAGKVVETKARW